MNHLKTMDMINALNESATIGSGDICSSFILPKRYVYSFNDILGQCSITAFLAQDIFGGKVYGMIRPGGNYHCYNVVDGHCFDLTSEQFGEEKLCYDNNPEQFRDVHFKKEEKRLRYEMLKEELKKRQSLYQVVRIEEDLDFGCEERMEGSPVMAVVVLRDRSGQERRIRQEDQMLYECGIDEGSWVWLMAGC